MIEFFIKEGKKLNDLKPNKETNNYFNNLCNFCQKNDLHINEDENTFFLNNLCAIAEFEMEKYYSNLIINSTNPEEELKNFIYYNNYDKLTTLEYLNSKSIKDNIKEILFIWWWPLPLTSIILYKKFGVKSYIIDNNLESIEISKKLINKLWLDNFITIEFNDAKKFKTDKRFDWIYLASLLFTFWEIEIIENVKNLNFNFGIIRTSYNTRKLLYKSVDENIVKNYFNIEYVIHPKNDIINSIILITNK